MKEHFEFLLKKNYIVRAGYDYFNYLRIIVH